MAWWWRYVQQPGAGGDGLDRSVDFPTRSDAETWVGEQWRDLLASGVGAVVLLEDGTEVYGPMDLHPST